MQEVKGHYYYYAADSSINRIAIDDKMETVFGYRTVVTCMAESWYEVTPYMSMKKFQKDLLIVSSILDKTIVRISEQFDFDKLEDLDEVYREPSPTPRNSMDVDISTFKRFEYKESKE